MTKFYYLVDAMTFAEKNDLFIIIGDENDWGGKWWVCNAEETAKLQNLGYLTY